MCRTTATRFFSLGLSRRRTWAEIRSATQSQRSLMGFSHASFIPVSRSATAFERAIMGGTLIRPSNSGNVTYMVWSRVESPCGFFFHIEEGFCRTGETYHGVSSWHKSVLTSSISCAILRSEKAVKERTAWGFFLAIIGIRFLSRLPRSTPREVTCNAKGERFRFAKANMTASIPARSPSVHRRREKRTATAGRFPSNSKPCG